MWKPTINLIILSIYLLFFGNYVLSQNFSEKEQHQLDSLNVIITSSTSHDTSLASAYVSLSEILYVSSLDTIIPLCEKAKTIAEIALEKDPSPSVRRSLLISIANALNNLGYVNNNQGNTKKGLDYYQKALVIREEIGDIKGISISLNNIGYIYKDKGDISKALYYYQKSLALRRELGNKEFIANSLNNIGLIYDNQGDVPKALAYYHESLIIMEEIGDKYGISASYLNIGSVYRDQGDLTKSLEYQLKSLKIKEEIGDKWGIALSLNNIGVIYFDLNDFKKANEYYQKSLRIREEIGHKSGIAMSLNNIGNFYKVFAEKVEVSKKDSLLAIAIDYYRQSHLLYTELEDKDGISVTLHSIGAVLFDIGETNEAYRLAHNSLDIAEEIGYPVNIKNASGLLTDIYERQNKGMQALEMHKLYIIMRDSINNKEAQMATAKQQARYDYEKQKTIDDLENDKLIAIEKEEKQKQKIIIIAIGIGLVLVVGFLLFVFNRLRVTKKQKKFIEEQKGEVEIQRDIIKVAHKEITDSISYAKRIQSAILPPPQIVKEYLEDSFIYYIPKDVVAGDFYWMKNQNGKILFAAADCTGHGVPGAMVSVVCNNALNRSVREYGITDPGKILNKTREIVIQEFEKSTEEVKDGMDIALCTLDGNTLQYAGAYNPLWIVRKGELLETKANRWPIGISRDPHPYTTHTLKLEKGDVIYIFTDGFADQFGGEFGKKLKTRKLKELVLQVYNKPMEEQRKFIDNAFYDWKGDLEQVDDVCLIGVRV